eukprot:7386585-Prymnesium_polylepis.3
MSVANSCHTHRDMLKGDGKRSAERDCAPDQLARLPSRRCRSRPRLWIQLWQRRCMRRRPPQNQLPVSARAAASAPLPLRSV